MKIHRVLRENRKGVSYNKTFVLIPKKLEYDGRFVAGAMYLSFLSNNRMLLAKSRKYVDDVQVTVSEYWHKKSDTERYHNLRVNIPKRIAERMDGFSECDMVIARDGITMSLREG